jgi:hypothetical protein
MMMIIIIIQFFIICAESAVTYKANYRQYSVHVDDDDADDS